MNHHFQVVESVKTTSSSSSSSLSKLTKSRRKRGVVVVRPPPRKSPPERPQIVQDAIANNEPIYYFGLGSNMLRSKLENRGLNGTKIEILTMEAAIVPNYRLAFNLRGFPPIEPGMGSLEPIIKKKNHINGPSPTHDDEEDGGDGGGGEDEEVEAKALLKYHLDECHGALVKLTPENYEKVMRSEGVGGNNAEQGYEEIVVDAYPYRGSGGGANNNYNNNKVKPIKAIALRARPHVRLNFDPCPSARYMTILKDGAKELGLKPCYQEFLAQHPVQKLSTWQRKVAIYNIVCTFTISSKLKWWRSTVSKFQNRLLFWVYVPPTASQLQKVGSDIVSAIILLPGAMFGCLYYNICKLTGKMPPQLTRMMMFLAEEKDGSEQKEVK